MAFEHIPLDQTLISYTTGTARKNFTVVLTIRHRHRKLIPKLLMMLALLYQNPWNMMPIAWFQLILSDSNRWSLYHSYEHTGGPFIFLPGNIIPYYIGHIQTVRAEANICLKELPTNEVILALTEKCNPQNPSSFTRKISIQLYGKFKNKKNKERKLESFLITLKNKDV